MKEKLLQLAQRARQYAQIHKRVTGLVLLVVVLVAYFLLRGGSASAQTRYYIGTVEKGTLTLTVSGTGQISASDQVDVKPKVSDDVISVDVAAGQEVKTGQALVHLDTRDAIQAVQNAQIALSNAQITLQKLQQNQTVDSTAAQDDLAQAYQDALTGVTNAFLPLPDILDTMHGVLYDSAVKATCSPNICAYSDLVSNDFRKSFTEMSAGAEQDYRDAQNAYASSFPQFRMLRRDATPEQIVTILSVTQDTVGRVLQSLKSERNLLDTMVSDINTQASLKLLVAEIPTQVTTYQSAVSSAMSSMNGVSTQLSNQMRAITDAKQTQANATLSDPLDLASQQNTVQQRRADLWNAQRDYADHIVRAPFDGVVAKVNVKKGDSASSGTTIATIISKSQLAVLSLNEVDVAKVALGQKATLTFDAVPDLTMTGTVAEVDSIGTATQGVVNYNVTINLDSQDARVRPGMSTSATVIAEAHQDVLMVPSSAVKKQGTESYVQSLDGLSSAQMASTTGIISSTAPRQIIVQVGASSDTMTEITSGVNEGDEIIIRTTSATATSSTGSSGSLIPGGGGGGTFRALGR